jgi:oligopeptide transport system substrate-binding protein
MRRAPRPSQSLCAILAPSVSLALCLAAAGCSANDANPYFGTSSRPDKDIATFYLNNATEPEYLDPGKSSEGVSTALILQLFEGLTTADPRDGHPVQGVATHWDQSDDNRLFRFHLRPDARWSDGKPVTAYDFEYAWRRVLRPATASRSVANLYALKNAELFSAGALKVVARDLTLREGPRDDAPPGEKLTQGTAVRILARSPMKVKTTVAPLAEVPTGATLVNYTPGNAQGTTPEQLSFGGARPPVGPDRAGGWKDAIVDVLFAGPPVDCNGAASLWLLVQRGGERGFLPACLLTRTKGGPTMALVERDDDLPTFKPRPETADPAALPPPPRAGFVNEEELREDPSVVGVRATSALTLEVELEQPTPYFTDLTSFATLFPVRKDVIEAFEQRGEGDLWFRPGNIVTNGPYALDEWKFRYEITMQRNPFYWNRDKLKVHRIVWLEVDDSRTTMNLYKAGEIDYIGDNLSLPSEYHPLLQTKRDYVRTDYLAIYWYEFNTRKPPLDDVRVRRALNMAVDKEQLVEKVTRGGQQPATHYVPDFTGLGYADAAAADKAAGTDPFAGPDVVYNPERARALMKEAGYEVVKDGDGYRANGCPPIEILLNHGEGQAQIAVTIQAMWKRNLGVTATLQAAEFKVMLKNLREGQFQVLRAGWQGDYNHPHTFLDQFRSSSPQNQTGWGDAAFDTALRRAASTPEPRESIRRYREAEAIAVAAMPRMPLYFYTKSTLVKPWVKGFSPSVRGMHLLQFFWIDPLRPLRSPDRAALREPAFPPMEFPPPGVFSP